MNAEQVANKLSEWIKEKVLAAGCRGTVLGLSGGIDSAVLAVLCQRAFPQNTLAVIIPIHSSQEDVADALAVADKFSIPAKTVTLDAIYDSLIKTLSAESDTAPSRLAQANLKARLRMVTLYYFANQLQYMVAGSGNKSELTTGYFTKYGDGGVDILPLGSLVKRQVRELAVYLGIPQPIIDKPPTAGLWPGQTDEGELGFTYEELDRYLETGKASAEVKRKINGMNVSSEHKRCLPPVAPI